MMRSDLKTKYAECGAEPGKACLPEVREGMLWVTRYTHHGRLVEGYRIPLTRAEKGKRTKMLKKREATRRKTRKARVTEIPLPLLTKLKPLFNREDIAIENLILARKAVKAAIAEKGSASHQIKKTMDKEKPYRLYLVGRKTLKRMAQAI